MTTIIAGTNRPNSHTLKLALYYKKKLEKKGLAARILSLTDLPGTIISTDLYKNRSPEFQVIQDIVDSSDKFIFIIPEYNGSFPGVLKVFIDACDYPGSFSGKKAALVGLSTGTYGNIRGVDHFVGICHYINLHVMPLRIHIPSIHKEMDQDGNLTSENTIKFVDQQIERFIEY